MATYDAGIVTAYGAAVRGGYTGTYEEFCRQQAGYAQSAAAVAQAKEDVQELVEGIPADYTQLSEDVDTLKEDLGDLSNLETTDKSNLVSAINEAAQSGGGSTEWSAIAKTLLLTILTEGIYGTDQSSNISALNDALFPPANLTRISCVYTQSGTVYDTDSLDSLKSDLVVTAYLDDGSTQIVTTYTLSGTLTEGTSTVTISYGGKTTTFSVTVTADPYAYGYPVTYNLTGYTSDNEQEIVPLANPFYSATLTLESGYDEGTITVTMDGTDITSSAVTGTYILIQEVTGAIVITATGVQLNDVSVEGPTAKVNILDVYPSSRASGGNSSTNQVIIWYCSQIADTDKSFEFTLTNNTESAISLSRCYIGALSNPYVAVSGRFVIEYATEKSGTIQPGGYLKFSTVVPARMYPAITGISYDVEVTCKVNGTLLPSVISGYTGYNVGTEIGFTSFTFYDSADDSGNVVTSGYFHTYGTQEGLSAGTYEVVLYNPDGIEYSISAIATRDANVGGGKCYNAHSCISTALAGVTVYVATIDVPEGHQLIFRAGTAPQNTSMIYVKEVI